MNPLTYFVGNQQEKPKCGLGINLGQIRSNVVKKSKETGIINSCFHILHGGYLLKQKELVVQTLELEFKANMARNATFEGY